MYLCVLCGSENKQRLFPYTASTDWFLWQWFNSLQPSGHYMYRQFNIQQFHVLPTHCINMFFMSQTTWPVYCLLTWLVVFFLNHEFQAGDSAMQLLPAPSSRWLKRLAKYQSTLGRKILATKLIGWSLGGKTNVHNFCTVTIRLSSTIYYHAETTLLAVVYMCSFYPLNILRQTS